MPASLLSWSAVAVLATHAVTVSAFRQIWFEPFSSGVFQIAAAIIATIACYRASVRSHDFARRFWLLTGVAFTAWTAAQCLDVFNEFWLRSQDTNPNWLLLVFFLAVAPLTFTLFQWVPAADEMRWLRVVDAVQLLLLIGVTGFVYLRISDSASGLDLTIGRLQMLHWRNLLLAGALVLRACCLRGEARRLFAIVGASFALYTVGSLFGNWALEVWEVGTGTWFDLAWTIPFVLLAINASEWKAPHPQNFAGPVADVDLPLPGILSFAVISIAMFGLKQHALAGTMMALASFAALLLRMYFVARLGRAGLRIASSAGTDLLGHVPICAACKRIRDDDSGRWNPLEAHFEARYGTRFSHGMCDLCAQVWYPAESEN